MPAEAAREQLLVEHLPRRADRGHPALGEQHQPVGELGGERQVMHDGDHRQPVFAAQLVDEFQCLDTIPDVECARRLVQQQHRGLLRQGAGEHHALHLATGERREHAGRQVPDPEAGQQGGAAAAVPGRLDPEIADVRGAAEQGVVGDRHAAGPLRLLRHVGEHPGEPPAGQPVGDLAVDRDRAVVVGEVRHGAQQAGLAGTVGPDQADPFARRRSETHPVDRRGVAAGVAQGDRGEGQHGQSTP